jgi:hypothetical protein
MGPAPLSLSSRAQKKRQGRRVTGGDGTLDYPLTRARVTPIIYFGVTTCHELGLVAKERIDMQSKKWPP